MARRVKLIKSGMEQLVKGEGSFGGVRDHLDGLGENVAAQMRSNAEVESGGYRDGIVVTSDVTDRYAVRIGSTVDYALKVEAAHGTAARALDAAG